MPLVDYSVPKNIGLCPCLRSACCAISARVRYSTALPHLLLFVIFLISHVYYICYFLLTMYGHQGNAGILSHVISCQLPKTVISFLYPIMFKKSILYKADGLHSDIMNLELPGFYYSFLTDSKYRSPRLWDLTL